MSYIGIIEYVIGVIHDKDIWYYVGEKDTNEKRLRMDERYSSFLVDATALSRKDNKTETCPECGVREAIEAYCRANK